MSFIQKGITIDQLNKLSPNTLANSLGIEMIEVGDDFISAKMPVDQRTHQPLGMLHGGASVALAETLGSIGTVTAIAVPPDRNLGV